MRKIALCLFLLSIGPASAQNGPSVVELQRAISVLQGQRNAAHDQAAQCGVDHMTARDGNAKLKAEIEELKKKIPAENTEPNK